MAKEVKKAEESTALTTKKAVYPLAKAESLFPEGVGSFDEIRENLEGQDDIQFPRIRFPNDARFHMTADDDEGVTEFTGVILYYVRQNTYWESGYDPNNPGPPVCFSLDGKKGTVARNSEGAFGDCRDCKYNQFNSAKQGRGKACRNQIKMFVQLEGKAIPVAFSISPSNLQAFTGSYLLDQVTQRNLAYWRVVTKFTAYKKPKEQFGRIKWEVVGEFKDDELVKVKQLRDFWLPMLTHDTNTLGEVNENEGGSSSAAAEPSEPAAAPAPQGKTVTPKKAEPAPASDEDPPF